MEENYEINSETLRSDLEEILDWLKDEIMVASKSVPITEQGKKGGASEFSQDIDAYDKLWKIYQAELSRDLDSDIRRAELDRKNCEYLESIAKRTEELKIKMKELDLKTEEFENVSRYRERELDLKHDEFKLKEEDAGLKDAEVRHGMRIKEREADVKEHEADIKERTAKENGRWWNKPIVQTAAVCATTLVVNGFAIYMNGSESPLKSIYEKWMVRPKF